MSLSTAVWDLTFKFPSMLTRVVFSKIFDIELNDNELSEGIDPRLIKRSKYGGEMGKIIEKECHEQADLLRKEVMTDYNTLED